MLQRGLHDTTGYLIALARLTVLKQLSDVKVREKDIPLQRGSPSYMQMRLLFETMKRKCEVKFSKQSIDQAYAFLDPLDRKGWQYFQIWTLPSLSEFVFYLTEKQNVLLVFFSDPSSREWFPFFSPKKSRLKRTVWLTGPLAVCECWTLEWRSHQMICRWSTCS